MIGMYKALIFSDTSFPSYVFEQVVAEFPFWRAVKRVYCDVRWPLVPFSYGVKVREYVPYPETALQEIQDADILVTQMGLVDERLIQCAPRLQVVGCLRSGPVNVDREVLKTRGIPLFFVPERSVEAVAEFTVGLFILARRRIGMALREMEAGFWNQNFYFCYENLSLAFSETVVGLLGFGRIARRVAEYLRVFRVQKILATDPAVTEEVMSCYGVEKVTLERLLQESDIVSLHVRYDNTNGRMFGRKEFSLMKPGSIFVNTARGELVDEEALREALERGIPAFACIDTLCDEPCLGKHPLSSFPQVILTPHIAGASRSTIRQGACEVAQQIAWYLEGREKHHGFSGT